MAVVVPLDASSSAYSVRCQLAGEDFQFDVNWNERDSSWYFSLSDGEATPILSGVKIVPGHDFLRYCPEIERKPRGVLVALDTSTQETRPGRDELGDRVIVLFLEPEDLS